MIALDHETICNIRLGYFVEVVSVTCWNSVKEENVECKSKYRLVNIKFSYFLNYKIVGVGISSTVLQYRVH